MKEKITFGVFGVAHHHSRPFAETIERHPRTKLVGVYDSDEKKGRAFADKFSIPFSKNIDGLLGKVQAGIVTCENAQKKDMAIALAKAGKHILSDKPLGISPKESAEIIKTCNDNNVKLQVGYLSRYTPEALEAKRIIDSGKIGKVQFVSGENRVDVGSVKELSPWLALSSDNGGRGAVLEHCVHVADLAQWYVGSPAVSAYAVRAKNLDPTFEVEDNFTIHVGYKNGACATLDGSYCRPTSGRSGDLVLWIAGEKGELRLMIRKKALELIERQEPRVDSSTIQTKLGDSYEGFATWNMIDDLVDCILNDKTPLTCGEDAMRINSLVEACYKSLKNGSRVKV